MPLAYISQLPRWVPFVVVLALAVGAFFAPGVIGAVLLLVIAGFFAWLGYLSFPTATPATRLLRVLTVAVLVAAAIAKVR